MSDEDNVEQDGGDYEHDGGDDDTTGVGEDATTIDGGNHTDGGACTDDGSSDPAAKKSKKDMKDWMPQVLAPICNEITSLSKWPTLGPYRYCKRVQHATRVHRPGKHVYQHQAHQIQFGFGGQHH